jgi:Protein of unknown function (DUF3551)
MIPKSGNRFSDKMMLKKETTMRLMLLALAALMVALVGDPRPGVARPWFPWCAQYADTRNLTECAFVTFAQCQASISGIGGSCIQNWSPAPAEPRRERGWRPFYR